MSKIHTAIVIVVLGLLLSLTLMRFANASCTFGQQSCSTSYGIGTYSINSGGSLDTTCSTSYCAKQALGETGVGNSTSTHYQIHGGINVDRQPSLQFSVNTSSVNLGVLSTGATATGTATFTVESYLSSGYSVFTSASPPSDGQHTMYAPSTPTASAVGTEQFGINLVANTSPSLGANPVQIPSSSYSYGCAGSSCSTNNYNQPNLYMYSNGSVIASSPSSSGETEYTISYIENISGLTPAGSYSMNQVLIATPAF